MDENPDNYDIQVYPAVTISKNDGKPVPSHILKAIDKSMEV